MGFYRKINTTLDESKETASFIEAELALRLQKELKKIKSVDSNLNEAENKNTVNKYIQGLTEGDYEKISSCLSDDISWEMQGMFNITGKELFNKKIEKELFEGNPVIQISRMTEEDNVVVAEGSIQGRKKDGNFLNAVFCDVFNLENGMIKKLITYQMDR